MTLPGYPKASPAGQILQYLQRQGEATVKELAELLGISTTAVRDHLIHLQADGMINVRAERHGPGRPRLVYALSEKAQSSSPKQYDRLISLLLRELAAEGGAESVERMLGRVGTRLANEYQDRISGIGMRERLTELRVLLQQRGVVAEVDPDGESIRFFSCPYYDVAHAHPQVCVMERRMIEQVIGEDLDLENNIRDGAHSCRFTRRPGEIALIPNEPKN